MEALGCFNGESSQNEGRMLPENVAALSPLQRDRMHFQMKPRPHPKKKSYVNPNKSKEPAIARF